MNNRKEFIEYVKHDDAKPLCSLQIGCSAGYDLKIYGLEWVSQTNYVSEENINALCDETSK